MWELAISIVLMIAGYVFQISPFWCAVVSFIVAANIAGWIWWIYKENQNQSVLYLQLAVLLLCIYGAFCSGVVVTVNEKKAEYVNHDNGSIDKAVAESQEIILLRAELSADKKARKNLEAENKRLSRDLSQVRAEYQSYKESADQTISKLKEENTQQKDKDNDKWLDFIHQ